MKKKIIFQIIIFLIILILSTFVYYKYLKIEKIDKKIDDSESILKDEKVNDSELVQESDKNIIENIKYFKEDIYGNKFILKAKKGEIIQDESKFVLLSDVTQIWEYGKNGELISEVALDLVPADQLYRTPPPRTGNILDEYDIIAKEIKEKRIITSKNPVIPHTENDQLVLKTGQALEVDYVGTNQNGIQFRLNDSDGLLTIPFDNVRSLTSRMGDVIYPEAIEYRKSQ